MPLQRLLALFDTSSATGSTNPFAAKLAEHLAQLEPARLEYLAGFAGQLTRVAYADDDVSDAERVSIVGILSSVARLSEKESHVVIDLLLGQLQALRGTDEHHLNRAVNAHATREEKEGLVDSLFAVAAADEMVSNVEDQEIRRIGHALEIPKERIMDIRSRYRDRLEVLQAAAAARSKRGQDPET